jgi:hypothetical protein
VSDAPKKAMSGVRASDETTEPATQTADCRYPRMKPTPKRAGASSSAISALGRTGRPARMSEGRTKKSDTRSLTSAPTAIPRKIHSLPDAVCAVAFRTCAQAVPSGYGSSSCACTISIRRSGIIAESPRTPPRNARTTTCRYGGAIPHRKSAGIVKIVPVASEVEAEPIVCERLASRIVAGFRRSRKTATVMTAAGIDAETVMPTRRPR